MVFFDVKSQLSQSVGDSPSQSNASVPFDYLSSLLSS